MTTRAPQNPTELSAPPSLDAVADATAFSRTFEPSTLAEVKALARDLRGSCAVPLIQREKNSPKCPLSEADLLGLLLLGRSLGLGVMQSINGIYIVEGKPMLAAQTMSAICRSRPRVCLYLTIAETTAERCVVSTRRAGAPAAETITWTIDEARRLRHFGTSLSWGQYPAAMLRARAISDLCRMVYSDLLLGLYSVEEMTGSTSDVLRLVDEPGTRRAVERHNSEETAAMAQAHAPAAPPSEDPHASDPAKRDPAMWLAQIAAATSKAALDGIAAAIATSGLSAAAAAVVRTSFVARRAEIKAAAAAAKAAEEAAEARAVEDAAAARDEPELEPADPDQDGR